jgi:hypothetical protein
MIENDEVISTAELRPVGALQRAYANTVRAAWANLSDLTPADRRTYLQRMEIMFHDRLTEFDRAALQRPRQ